MKWLSAGRATMVMALDGLTSFTQASGRARNTACVIRAVPAVTDLPYVRPSSQQPPIMRRPYRLSDAA